MAKPGPNRAKFVKRSTKKGKVGLVLIKLGGVFTGKRRIK